MQRFNNKQYLAIDIANHAGKDKLVWDERIKWVKDNYGSLEAHADSLGTKNKFLYLRAVKALRDTDKGIPVRYQMHLDAVNSGPQVMALLCKCKTTAESCSVVGKQRADLYTKIMDKIMGVVLSRQLVKDATIPAMYGSIAEPRNLLGEDTPQLIAFQKALYTAVPALKFLAQLGKILWDPKATTHEWTLPDGHHVVCPSTVLYEKRIELKEAGTSFTYQFKMVEGNENSTPLLINIIHSVDAYIMRQMVRILKKVYGLDIAHIHDNFLFALVNVTNRYTGEVLSAGDAVRMTYIGILTDIAKSDLLNNIIQQIKPGLPLIKWEEQELVFWKDVAKAEYPLS